MQLFRDMQPKGQPCLSGVKGGHPKLSVVITISQKKLLWAKEST